MNLQLRVASEAVTALYSTDLTFMAALALTESPAGAVSQRPPLLSTWVSQLVAQAPNSMGSGSKRLCEILNAAVS